jgi:hypothetical protein
MVVVQTCPSRGFRCQIRQRAQSFPNLHHAIGGKFWGITMAQMNRIPTTSISSSWTDVRSKGHFYKPAAWANFAPAVLAVHWVRAPCLPNPSARTSPARDGVEKFPKT